MGLLRKRFGKAGDQTPGVKAEPLNASETDLLETHREAFLEFQRRARLAGDPIQDAPRLGDELLAWWRQLPESERADANDLVWAIGTMIGDYLASRTNMSWMLVTDPFGTTIGLYAKTTGTYSDMVLSPLDSVAKRLENSGPGDLQHYADSSIAQIAKMRAS